MRIHNYTHSAHSNNRGEPQTIGTSLPLRLSGMGLGRLGPGGSAGKRTASAAGRPPGEGDGLKCPPLPGAWITMVADDPAAKSTLGAIGWAAASCPSLGSAAVTGVKMAMYWSWVPKYYRCRWVGMIEWRISKTDVNGWCEASWSVCNMYCNYLIWTMDYQWLVFQKQHVCSRTSVENSLWERKI